MVRLLQSIKGVVKNGVIVLPDEARLPDGTEVTVLAEVQTEESICPTDWAQLQEIIGTFNSGVSDVSERKNEYLAEAYYRCGREEKAQQEGER